MADSSVHCGACRCAFLLDHLEDFEFMDRITQRRGDQLFFDLPGFNKLLLEGIHFCLA